MLERLLWWLLPAGPPLPPAAMVAMETREDEVSPETEEEEEEEEDSKEEGFPFFTGDCGHKQEGTSTSSFSSIDDETKF